MSCMGRNRNRHNAIYFVVISLLTFLLSGCLFGWAVEIVRSDLTTDPAYEGRFINQRNREMVEVVPLANGTYQVTMEKEHMNAYVLSTQSRRVLIIDARNPYQNMYAEIETIPEGLKVTVLQLDAENLQVQQALKRNHVKINTDGRNVMLSGLRNTTHLKSLFSDPGFNQGISPAGEATRATLVFELLRR